MLIEKIRQKDILECYQTPEQLERWEEMKKALIDLSFLCADLSALTPDNNPC